ncbi:nucleoside 5-triphosphatase RdgB (dHAPTP, dITP,XTP-specific) [Helicobacter baculiformis]|uniref:Nucleoside 5-triphosphatase RdgB (DHAPTP, dITP,XTP-specific) n=1 Tax=Helicobacter baculiformis TaxID=427351 RepID=A0ABV7ZHV4_9HELI
MKSFRALEGVPSINEWIADFKAKEGWAAIKQGRGDFQNTNLVALLNQITKHTRPLFIDATNLHALSVYFSVQLCIKPTWINDRDQFYAPYGDSWQEDRDFLGDCLVFMLFHAQNRISIKQGANHFIPFKEQALHPKARYTHHTLLDFLEGKSLAFAQDKLFKTPRPTLPTFSPHALEVLKSAQEIYRYYHSHKDSNPNASLYDIKEFFAGRDSKNKLNPPSKAQDTFYKTLYATLQENLDTLAGQITPKVWEYGFLRY